jgi:hypothetical protein
MTTFTRDFGQPDAIDSDTIADVTACLQSGKLFRYVGVCVCMYVCMYA